MPHWPIYSYDRTTSVRYDLNRINKLLSALENPHTKIPPVIHIAGTNGKGSTVAFLRSIFNKAGYNVHSYTSPHLVNFNERITIKNDYITDEYLHYLCEKVRLVSEKNNIDPTFFEATTAVAFLAFAENEAEIVLLETGMGGRLDATNVIDKPLCAMITPISYDHAEYLGPTIQMIASEKAGIIKEKTPTFISMQPKEVNDVLFDQCIRKKSPYYAYEYDFGLVKQTNSFVVKTKGWEMELPFPSLKGDHQIINAGLVVFTTKKLLQQHFKIKDEHIIEGITKAEWPARVEKINLAKTKFSSIKSELWVDGAHNIGGAKALSEWIKDYKASTNKKVSMILGITKNRDANAFAQFFRGIVSTIYCVQVRSEPSSYTSEKLKELVLWNEFEKVPISFLEDAILMASENSDIILVTGSLFLAADLFQLLFY